ncbi:metallophosphoesterase family protein [Paenibacillus soyae]|uniref:Metallophosphoesterase n=1 Tax=Paenibacillus soyae TaxID=2969249 RepID=A0A9X2MTV9_9BACL|nr:metallophosphoesterase [Paenibacillus soyae]MCR2806724.1 metallophosphoesterase [Paenibacillus soyae]
MNTSLTGVTGLKIRAGDGLQELGHPEMLSTPLFYLAEPGDRLCLMDTAYKFNVATYAPEVQDRWIYTYDYAPDESWTVYRQDLNGNSYRQDDYLFKERVYFRVCLRKMNGTEFEGSEDINRILSFEKVATPTPELKTWLRKEVERVKKRVLEVRGQDELAFALLTDSHYTVNGTWEDTSASIQQLHKEIGLDGIIHLGDFTDGMVTREVCRYYVEQVLSDLKKCGVPVWATIGNHDTNYFRNSPDDRFSIQEQCELYLGRDEPRYSITFDAQKLRFLFLDSFDPEETLRYGYNAACIQWLKEQLEHTPDGWQVVLYSHLPPTSRLQYWAKEMRGVEEIMGLLNQHADKILAFMNGHNHADLLDNEEGFPIISLVNSKCEAFTEYKAEGFITPHRKLGESSQEAFDVMLVNAEKRQIRFVRFGAGKDKIVAHGRAEWL